MFQTAFSQTRRLNMKKIEAIIKPFKLDDVTRNPD